MLPLPSMVHAQQWHEHLDERQSPATKQFWPMGKELEDRARVALEYIAMCLPKPLYEAAAGQDKLGPLTVVQLESNAVTNPAKYGGTQPPSGGLMDLGAERQRMEDITKMDPMCMPWDGDGMQQLIASKQLRSVSANKVKGYVKVNLHNCRPGAGPPQHDQQQQALLEPGSIASDSGDAAGGPSTSQQPNQQQQQQHDNRENAAGSANAPATPSTRLQRQPGVCSRRRQAQSEHEQQKTKKAKKFHWAVEEYAHRLVCWARWGPPPDGTPEKGTVWVAMHTCGNAWCLTPWHIIWHSQSVNVADAHRTPAPQEQED